MRFNTRIMALAACLAALSGCISTHSYVDPQYRHASYSDLRRPNPPYVLAVKVEFERNGEARPAVDPEIRADIERSLRASGVALPYDGTQPATGEISFVLNNLANVAGGAAKSFGTGMTYGLVGSHLTDGYEMHVRLTQGDVVTERSYQHAIVTTVGHASGPKGVTPVNLGTAVNQVIDDLVLNSLKDLQASGSLLPQAGALPAVYTQASQ